MGGEEIPLCVKCKQNGATECGTYCLDCVTDAKMRGMILPPKEITDGEFFRNHLAKHKDLVNHPPHYNQGKIEVIEFIEDQKLGMHLGTSVKYICRAGKKDPSKLLEDLNKAIWYIRRFIEIQKPNPRRPNEMVEGK